MGQPIKFPTYYYIIQNNLSEMPIPVIMQCVSDDMRLATLRDHIAARWQQCSHLSVVMNFNFVCFLRSPGGTWKKLFFTIV